MGQREISSSHSFGVDFIFTDLPICFLPWSIRFPPRSDGAFLPVMNLINRHWERILHSSDRSLKLSRQRNIRTYFQSFWCRRGGKNSVLYWDITPAEDRECFSLPGPDAIHSSQQVWRECWVQSIQNVEMEPNSLQVFRSPPLLRSRHPPEPPSPPAHPHLYTHPHPPQTFHQTFTLCIPPNHFYCLKKPCTDHTYIM